MSRKNWPPTLTWRLALTPNAWRAAFRDLPPESKIIAVIGIFDWFTSIWTTLLGLWLASLGVAIGVGGEDRMLQPQFAVLLALLPWWAWAIVPSVAGAGLIFRAVAPNLTPVACLLGALWALVFTSSILLAVTRDTDTPVTGVATYGAMTLLLIATAAKHSVLHIVTVETSRTAVGE